METRIEAEEELRRRRAGGRPGETFALEAETDTHVYGAGAAAGLIAGVVMGLAAMGHSQSIGMGFWAPMKEIAGTWLGVDALVGGWPVSLLGVATHLLCAAFWGAVFSGLIRRRESIGGAFWEGLVFSVGVWLIMSYIGLPIFDRTMIPRVSIGADWWFYDHLIFGACLCVTPPLRRAFSPVPRRVVRAEVPTRIPTGV